MNFVDFEYLDVKKNNIFDYFHYVSKEEHNIAIMLDLNHNKIYSTNSVEPTKLYLLNMSANSFLSFLIESNVNDISNSDLLETVNDFKSYLTKMKINNLPTTDEYTFVNMFPNNQLAKKRKDTFFLRIIDITNNHTECYYFPIKCIRNKMIYYNVLILVPDDDCFDKL